MDVSRWRCQAGWSSSAFGLSESLRAVVLAGAAGALVAATYRPFATA